MVLALVRYLPNLAIVRKAKWGVRARRVSGEWLGSRHHCCSSSSEPFSRITHEPYAAEGPPAYCRGVKHGANQFHEIAWRGVEIS